MNGKYLLDTNIIIALFANEAVVQKNLAKNIQIFIPSVALGELYYGALKSRNALSNSRLIDEFAFNNAIIVCDEKTAWHYGSIKKYLKDKGKPVPENDIWIAAMSSQHEMVLVTRDEHFKEIEEVKVAYW